MPVSVSVFATPVAVGPAPAAPEPGTVQDQSSGALLLPLPATHPAAATATAASRRRSRRGGGRRAAAAHQGQQLGRCSGDGEGESAAEGDAGEPEAGEEPGVVLVPVWEGQPWQQPRRHGAAQYSEQQRHRQQQELHPVAAFAPAAADATVAVGTARPEQLGPTWGAAAAAAAEADVIRVAVPADASRLASAVPRPRLQQPQPQPQQLELDLVYSRRRAGDLSEAGVAEQGLCGVAPAREAAAAAAAVAAVAAGRVVCSAAGGGPTATGHAERPPLGPRRSMPAGTPAGAAAGVGRGGRPGAHTATAAATATAVAPMVETAGNCTQEVERAESREPGGTGYATAGDTGGRAWGGSGSSDGPRGWRLRDEPGGAAPAALSFRSVGKGRAAAGAAEAAAARQLMRQLMACRDWRELYEVISPCLGGTTARAAAAAATEGAVAEAGATATAMPTTANALHITAALNQLASMQLPPPQGTAAATAAAGQGAVAVAGAGAAATAAAEVQELLVRLEAAYRAHLMAAWAPAGISHTGRGGSSSSSSSSSSGSNAVPFARPGPSAHAAAAASSPSLAAAGSGSGSGMGTGAEPRLGPRQLATCLGALARLRARGWHVASERRLLHLSVATAARWRLSAFPPQVRQLSLLCVRMCARVI